MFEGLSKKVERRHQLVGDSVVEEAAQYGLLLPDAEIERRINSRLDFRTRILGRVATLLQGEKEADFDG